VLAYLALISLAMAPYDRRALAATALLMAGLTALNQRYYLFFYRKRGVTFTARVWLVHLLHHLCNGLSFATGTTLFLAARHLGLLLPGALSPDPWNAGSRRPGTPGAPCADGTHSSPVHH
jgi:uncharacterized RDD family membrane protein YckC